MVLFLDVRHVPFRGSTVATGVGMLMVPNVGHSVAAFLICAFPSFF